MAGESRTGTDWSDKELDLIVANYFAMLREEQQARTYVKATHRAGLMKSIRRSKGSIEFKHQNISAVLSELGMPRIEGYKPAQNYQGAIFGAIDRYLSLNDEPIPFEPHASSGMSEEQELYMGPPPVRHGSLPPRPEALERLIRKFDPAARDEHNRVLGRAGEERIVKFERQKLINMDRSDLAKKIRWVSQEDGDGAGYDILSFDRSGAERLIEVKTTCGNDVTPFYLTRNERDLAQERPTEFRLYRLYQFSKRPGLYELTPPLEPNLRLEPITFRASFT
jgi:hypothetical protein